MFIIFQSTVGIFLLPVLAKNAMMCADKTLKNTFRKRAVTILELNDKKLRHTYFPQILSAWE